MRNILKAVKLVRKDSWAWIDIDRREELKDLLTITSTPMGGGRRFTLRLYVDDELFGIPRALFPGIPPEGAWKKINLKFKGKLRPHQEELFDVIIGHAKYNCGGIIKATTGSGKTVLGLAVACALSYPTLVVVPTKAIMRQWIERVREFTNVEAGIIQQNTCDVKPITIAMIHSLARRGNYGLYDRFGLVIYDEVHVTSAETFSRTVHLFNSRYRLGLSATPRRKDGMENVFLWHIGSVIAEYSAVEIKPKVVALSYYSTRTAQIGCVGKDGLILGKYLNKIAKDTVRTRLISKAVARAYKEDREVLVLSDRLKVLDDMRAILTNEFNVPRADIGYMTGTTKQPERKILLATYECAGLGFDKPALDTLVFATPRSDVEQAVGRLMRSGKRNRPLVIDVVDRASPIMISWFHKRAKLYEKFGCEVKYL